MVSTQSVSSPPNNNPKKKSSKRHPKFGPFTPNVLSPEFRTPITRRKLNLGLSPESFPCKPKQEAEPSRKLNNTADDAIVISSSTSMSSLKRSSFQLDLQFTNLSQHVAEYSKKVEEHVDAKTKRITPQKMNHYVYRDCPKDTITVVLKSWNYLDSGIPYAMGPYLTFEGPMKDYAKKIDAKVEEIMLRRNGQDILTIDTPAGLGLDNGAEIEVKAVDCLLNTDTRFKMITIKKMDDEHPIFLQLLTPPTRTMESIHKEWADHIGEDIDSFRLTENGKYVKNTGLVWDANIKNGAKLRTVYPVTCST